MKIIPLTHGQVAKVSDEWYEKLNKDKWYARYSSHTKSYYAERKSSKLLGKRKAIHMHRVVAGTPDGMECDHKDGDTLNNLPDNLRNCTTLQNRHNNMKYSNNTSGFKGVTAHRKKWMARIKVFYKYICLGTYSTPEEAAHVYDEAAKKYYGDYAGLNFPR